MRENWVRALIQFNAVLVFTDLFSLSEDVIEFERKAGVSRDRRKKRSGRPIGELDTETESESDGSEEKEVCLVKFLMLRAAKPDLNLSVAAASLNCH